MAGFRPTLMDGSAYRADCLSRSHRQTAFPGRSAAHEFHPPLEGEGCERSERGGV